MEDKRKRTGNFTSDEKSVLTELIMKYKELVENKKTDATTNVEKTRGWKLLCEEFNAVSTHRRRTPENLKTCWENIKRASKKQSASRKRELFKTGGGEPQTSISKGADLIIEGILGPALDGLENPYDCDALLDGKEVSTTQDIFDDFTQTGSKVELLIDQENEVVENEAFCLNTSPVAGTSVENKENNLQWQGWTPNMYIEKAHN